MGNRKIIFLQLSKKAFTKRKKYATITRLASSVTSTGALPREYLSRSVYVHKYIVKRVLWRTVRCCKASQSKVQVVCVAQTSYQAKTKLRTINSAGRVSPWRGGSHRFESCIVHHLEPRSHPWFLFICVKGVAGIKVTEKKISYDWLTKPRQNGKFVKKTK